MNGYILICGGIGLYASSFTNGGSTIMCVAGICLMVVGVAVVFK